MVAVPDIEAATAVDPQIGHGSLGIIRSTSAPH
jgi:hypothetical protein